jgi:hypothetical protein
MRRRHWSEQRNALRIERESGAAKRIFGHAAFQALPSDWFHCVSINSDSALLELTIREISTMDPAIALLKYYAARSVIRPVARLGVPILSSEYKAGWRGDKPGASWYALAVSDALALGTLPGASRGIGPHTLRRPDGPDVVQDSVLAKSAPLLDQMARKASVLLGAVRGRYPSLTRDSCVDLDGVADAAQIMFHRAWPKLAQLLCHHKSSSYLASKPEEAVRILDSCLKEALRYGGSPDVNTLEPGDLNSAGEKMSNKRTEPVVTGNRIKDLELFFALSDRVIIAEHLRKTCGLCPEAAGHIALLLRGHGQANRNANKTQEALEKIGFTMKSKCVGIASTARLAADQLKNDARKAVKDLAPVAQDKDLRAVFGGQHAKAIRDLLPEGHRLRRSPETYQVWLRTYHVDTIVWRQEGLPDLVQGPARSDTHGEQPPSRVPEEFRDHSTSKRVEDPVAKLIELSDLTHDELWNICVRWAKENYPFENPPDELGPVQESRNQVAMLLGMPELLLPHSLPVIRALAEGKRRDGHHTQNRWELMFRLLGKSIASLQAYERDLQQRLAQALQTWRPPDKPTDDGAAEADGGLA